MEQWGTASLRLALSNTPLLQHSITPGALVGSARVNDHAGAATGLRPRSQPVFPIYAKPASFLTTLMAYSGLEVVPCSMPT
jgi:hypothetical protein